MDVCESDRTSEAPRLSLDATEGNDGTSQSHVRENRVRSKSPTPMRFPLSNTAETSAMSVSTQKRGASAERRRPTMQGFSAPVHVHGASIDMEPAARKVTGSKLTDSLWPSTMRTQSEPFQSDSLSLPVTKRENMSEEGLSDRTLKPSSHVAYKQTIMPSATSKATPERMKAILKGKNVNDHSENLKPSDGSHVRLVDQHRWPSTTGSNVLSKKINHPDESTKTCTIPDTNVVAPTLRRMSLPNSSSKPLQESSSDDARLLSDPAKLKIEKLQTSLADDGRLEFDKLQRISNQVPSSSSQKTALVTPAVRSDSFPTAESQPSSPNKLYGLASRCVSPSRTRALTPTPAIRVSSSSTAIGVSSSPAASIGVSPFPTAIGVSLFPSTAIGVSPSPAATRVPSPAAIGVSSSPAAPGASPAPSKGVGPSLATTKVITVSSTGVDLAPSTGVDLAPLRRVNHTPITTEVGAAPTATRVNLAPSRGVRPTSASKEIDFAPFRGVSPPSVAAGVDLAPSRGISPSSAAIGVGLAPSNGISHTLISTEVIPTPTTTGVDHPPSRGLSLTPASTRIDPTPSRRVSPPPVATGTGLDLSTWVNPIPADTSPFVTRGVGSSVAAREIHHTLAKEVGLTPTVRGVSPSFAVKEIVHSLAAKKIDPTIATRNTNPAPIREVSPSPDKEVDGAPHIRRVSSARVTRGASPTLTARTGSPTFGSREVIPTFVARGASPTPTGKGASRMPVARGASPTLATRGVSPTLATRGANPTLATRGANPTLATTGVSPTPNAKGAYPTHADRGTSPMPIDKGAVSTSSTRGANPTLDRRANPTSADTGSNYATNARVVSPTCDAKAVNPTQMRPSSPRKSCNSNTISVSEEIGPSPMTDVDASARGVGLAPVRETSPTPAAKRTSLAPLRGVSHFLSSMGASLTSVVRGAKPTPSAKEVNSPRDVRGVSPIPSTRVANSPHDVRGVSPTVSTSGVSPASPTKGDNPMPAARKASPAIDARGASPTRDVRAVGSHDARTVNPTHTRPSSPSQSCKSNTVSVFTEIGPPVKDDGPAPTRGVSPSPSAKGSSLAPLRGVGHFLSSMGGSLTSVVKGVKPTHSSREVSSPHATRGVSPTNSAREVNSPHTTRGVSPTTSARVVSPPHATRGISPTPSTRAVSPPRATRGVGSRAKGISLNPIWPSIPKQSLNSNMASFFTFPHIRKGKKVSYDIDKAKYLVLLYNIQMQWRFLNASTEAALDLQKVTAEESLFNASRTNSELRDSIAAKKIDIDLLIMQLKLYAVLNRQMPFVEEWASIESEHEAALSSATKDLLASTNRLPVSGGVKVDIKAVKKVVYSTLQVMLTMRSSIQSMLSKLEGTHCLASELATLVSHERALLDECEILLASADPLWVEEYSLRAYLIQSNEACKSE